MKYLIVSDNHGNRDVLVNLVNQYQGKVDAMFHCGDSELEPTDSLWQSFHVVTGNCDYDRRYQKHVVVETPEDKVYMTHGHLSAVRLNTDTLYAEAKEVGATIALYGHTHVLDAQLKEGILIVNPGSICQPRFPYSVKTYAVIETSKEAYQVTYYDHTHRVVPELAKTFQR